MRLRHHGFAILVLLAAITSVAAAEPALVSNFSYQPQILVNGSACLFTVTLKNAPGKVTAQWMGHDLAFSPVPGGTWYALAGVALETKPGSYDLTVDATMSDGRVLREVHPVTVRAAK